MLLAKDDLPIRTLHRPPSPDAPLEGPSRASAQIWMAAAEFLEDGNRSQSGRSLQHRHDFIIPDIGEGIGSASFSTRLLFPGKSEIRFEPADAVLNPAFAPAIAGECLRRKFMNSLI
jgi:hypothetical protein